MFWLVPLNLFYFNHTQSGKPNANTSYQILAFAFRHTHKHVDRSHEQVTWVTLMICDNAMFCWEVMGPGFMWMRFDMHHPDVDLAPKSSQIPIWLSIHGTSYMHGGSTRNPLDSTDLQPTPRWVLHGLDLQRCLGDCVSRHDPRTQIPRRTLHCNKMIIVIHSIC